LAFLAPQINISYTYIINYLIFHLKQQCGQEKCDKGCKKISQSYKFIPLVHKERPLERKERRARGQKKRDFRRQLMRQVIKGDLGHMLIRCGGEEA